MEEQRELATTRLSELEKVQHDYQEALKAMEKLKMDVRTIPQSSIPRNHSNTEVLNSLFRFLNNLLLIVIVLLAPMDWTVFISWCTQRDGETSFQEFLWAHALIVAIHRYCLVQEMVAA